MPYPRAAFSSRSGSAFFYVGAHLCVRPIMKRKPLLQAKADEVESHAKHKILRFAQNDSPVILRSASDEESFFKSYPWTRPRAIVGAGPYRESPNCSVGRGLGHAAPRAWLSLWESCHRR